MSAQKSRRSTKSIDFIVTPTPEGTNPSNLIFHEWFDDEIIDRSPLKIRQSRQKLFQEEELLYDDPHLIILPKEIEVAHWKRASEIFHNSNLVIFEEKVGFSDLTVGSAHLLHSEFIRNFISTICELEYLNRNKPWMFEGDPYTLLNDYNQWMPWYHIYSPVQDNLKGNEKTKIYYEPTVNRMGKYAVRLFWMGTWRKVYVDDKIPVNHQNVPLLPSFEVDVGQFEHIPTTRDTKPRLSNQDQTESSISSRSKHGKDADSKRSLIKETGSFTMRKVELWPFLLLKAIVKLSMLSRVGSDHLVDFSMIQMLTGWTTIKIQVNEFVTMDALWNIFSEYSDNYKWPQEESDIKKADGSNVNLDKKQKVSRKPSRDPQNIAPNPKDMKYSMICVRCSDLRLNRSMELEELAPCWGHAFLIDEIRNIPLTKPPDLEPLPPWKKFRWEKWAIEQGIYNPPSVTESQKKYLHIVTPFKQNTLHRKYSTTKGLIKSPSDYISDNLVGRLLGSELVKQREKSMMEQSSHAVGTKTYNPISVSFDAINPHLISFMVFFKPSIIQNQTKISDLRELPFEGQKKSSFGKAPNYHFVQWTKEMSEFRNGPLYLFIDSLKSKLVIVSYSHEGATNIFYDKTKKNQEESISTRSSNKWNESSLGTSKSNMSNGSALLILQRFKHNLSHVSNLQVKDELESEMWDEHFEGKLAHLLIKYVKICNDGKLLTSISTYGSKSKMLLMDPGRQFLEIWINCDTSYVLNISSNTPFTVGCLEEVLENVQKEPEALKSFINNISLNFGNLIVSFGQENFLAQLRNFYASYKPNSTLDKKELMVLHETFFKEFLNMIFYNVNDREKKIFGDALSVLFVEPNIWNRKRIVMSEHSNADFSYLPDEFKTLYLEMLHLAVTVQKHFKRKKVMELKAAHSPENVNHSKVSATLSDLYKKFFSAATRSDHCANLTRKLLSRHDMKEISKKYDFYQDLDAALNVYKVTGTAEVTQDKWVPITRCLFYCHKSPVTISIYLFTELTNYFVRVFNNDNTEEIQRLVNNVNRYTYVKNLCGYTVIAYGFSNNRNPVNYKMCLVSKRNYKEEFHVVQENLKAEFFRNFYIPTVDDVICKYKITVAQNSMISLRVSTTFENVQLRVTIKNDEGSIVNEITGKENIIIPVAILSVNYTNQVDVVSACSSLSSGGGFRDFFVEVQILEGTWPLKVTEWQTIRQEVINNFMFSESWQSVFQKKEKKTNKEPFTTPSYCLQVLYRSSDSIRFQKITQKEDELKQFKKQIFKDESRFHKGKEIRDEFLMKKFPKFAEKSDSYERSSLYSTGTGDSVELMTFIYKCSLIFKDFYVGRSVNNPFSYKHFISAIIYDNIPKSKLLIVEEGQAILKTEKEKEEDKTKWLEETETINNHLYALEENLKNKLTLHIEKFSLLEFWLLKIFENNEQSLQEGYASRDFYAKYLESELNNNKESDTSETGVNKQKNKKKK